MQEDYTQAALEYINVIIANGTKVGKSRDLKTLEQHDGQMYHNIYATFSSVVAYSIKTPKEVYLSFMSQEVLEDPVFAWALWWAKEKGFVKHFGPAGTTGWALYRSTPVSLDEVYVGNCSPFNPSSMMQYMDHILKYSALVHTKSMEKHRDAEKSIEKTRNELESEKQYARIQSRIVWS